MRDRAGPQEVGFRDPARSPNTVEPDDSCARCPHVYKWHAPPEYGSECRIVSGTYWRGERVPHGVRTRKCPCYRFEAKP